MEVRFFNRKKKDMRMRGDICLIAGRYENVRFIMGGSICNIQDHSGWTP